MCYNYSMKNAKDILIPILDVMTGSDGGVAYAKLQHGYLTDFIKLAESGNIQAIEAVKAFETVSKFCTHLLKK